MLDNTYKHLEAYKRYVIQQSKANLTRGKKNVSKQLYNGIKGEIVKDKNFAIIGFSMPDYGYYQDEGVKGAKSFAKAPNSRFKFGSGTGRKGGLTNGINKWVKDRRIQFKDRKTGRFLSYKSTAFLISRSIYQKGIAPSLFFTKPFEQGYKKYIEANLNAEFEKDLDIILDINLR